ncbi:MAG TPA: hypothetical protein VJN18_07305 [Polyangiaceae bacterium]|nr:hypothetical protein [Polyangiaceae bacterium]
MTAGRHWLLALALVGLALGCGGTTQGSERESGNTNWLKECTIDAQCGGALMCLCGLCRTPCEGATLCDLEPERSCVAAQADGAEPAPAPEVALESADAEAYATDLALLDDGSVVLVGGTDRMTLGSFAPTYPTFWLRRLHPDGSMAWDYTEPPLEPGNVGTGRSVAALPSGEVVALSTIYDGTDTPALRRFGGDGDLLESWSLDPGITTLRAAPGGELFGSGSRLIEDREGRPFVSAWLGRIAGQAMVWEWAREGSDGSISAVGALASSDAGDLVVGGTLGIEQESNAAVPWLARFDASGTALWQQAIEPDQHSACLGTQVGMTASGASLAAVSSCAGPWVRAYDTAGKVLWERRFERTISALVGLDDGGYAIALGSMESWYQVDPPPATLLRFDAEHRLVWQVELEQCYSFERLVVAEEGLLALAGCPQGYALNLYADP